MRIGDIELSGCDDGLIRLPPQFYVGVDLADHPFMVEADGRVHIPIGCFLVRTGDRVVLLDAGMGPVTNEWGEGGRLPQALADLGVSPSEVDTVVCTHLHGDHVGWLVQEGRPFFPNATVRFGAGDWDRWVKDAHPEDRTRAAFQLLDEQGRLDPLEGDMVAVAPGLTARHTPGHTEGHYALVLSSGQQRAYLLGDAVECPLQLEEPDLAVISDIDPALAASTREALWREIEGTDSLMGAAHFPGLQMGRVLTGEGRRWFS